MRRDLFHRKTLAGVNNKPTIKITIRFVNVWRLLVHVK